MHLSVAHASHVQGFLLEFQDQQQQQQKGDGWVGDSTENGTLALHVPAPAAYMVPWAPLGINTMHQVWPKNKNKSNISKLCCSSYRSLTET